MSKKTNKVFTVLYIIAFFIMLTAASFAYFTYDIKISHVSPSISTESKITEFISFNVGSDIKLAADNTNFTQDFGNVSSTSLVNASLKLNGNEELIKHYYDLYLDIENNNFVYSTEDKRAELIMTVIDPNGKELTNIDGINYVSIATRDGVVSGFDITELRKGKYYIAKKYKIETNSEINQEWEVSVTLVNLNENQNANKNKELIGAIKIEKDD